MIIVFTCLHCLFILAFVCFFFFFFYSYATEGDIRIPKIYTKTGDKGSFF